MYDSDKRHCDNLTKKDNNLKNSWRIKKDIIWKYKTPSSSTMLYSDDVVIVAWRKLQSKSMHFSSMLVRIWQRKFFQGPKRRWVNDENINNVAVLSINQSIW